MKTNQIMEVEFSRGILQIGHKDMMGDLVDLFNMGNSYRLDKGLDIISRDKYLSLGSTKELIDKVTKNTGSAAYTAKKGKGGGAWAHLYILVDAAMYLDVDFKLEIIERSVNDKLLRWRDESGNNFIDLNAQVSISAEAVFGKPAHTGHYVALATILRRRVLPDNHPGWNNATPAELQERSRIEDAMTTMLKCGVVRDWEHLKELADKV